MVSREDIRYNRSEDSYYIEQKIDGQTYHMEFQGSASDSDDTVIFNIYLYIVNKRKSLDRVMANKSITGKNWISSYTFCKSAFTSLLDEVIEYELPKYKKMVVYCTWIDGRRRDAYFKFLSRFGFEYKHYYGQKCIGKEYINEVK